MSDKKWDVYVYGDINVDLIIPNVSKFPLPGQEDVVASMDTYVGGGAALFTLGLGKLKLNPVFQGTVGDDCYGRFILEEFQKKNVDTQLIGISQQNKTGISLSFTNEADRAFLTYRGTNDEIDLSKIRLDMVRQAGHIHLTGYMGSRNHQQYIELVKNIKKDGSTTISFDVGWDDEEEWYSGIYELFPYVDVLFMNETEAVHYAGKDTVEEAAADFAKTCPLVVVKLGKKGSIARYQDTWYEAKPYTVQAVDTTGAGDSFNAGFIYGFVREKEVMECLQCGNGCGALSVTRPGGNTGFPTKEELTAFLAEREATWADR